MHITPRMPYSNTSSGGFCFCFYFPFFLGCSSRFPDRRALCPCRRVCPRKSLLRLLLCFRWMVGWLVGWLAGVGCWGLENDATMMMMTRKEKFFWTLIRAATGKHYLITLCLWASSALLAYSKFSSAEYRRARQPRPEVNGNFHISSSHCPFAH